MVRLLSGLLAVVVHGVLLLGMKPFEWRRAPQF